MSISYSGLTNYGKVGTPSVDSWGTNMNIIKDPPRSIHTRRKDRVGSTTLINQQIDEGNDRQWEAINVYARGVNPFVSVEYSNNGSNIGRGNNNNIVTGGPVQAKLPNRIMKDGAFRPPTLLPQDLLPLSRMRRPNTAINPRVSDVNYNLKPYTSEHKVNGREIKKNTIKTNIRPSKTYRLERPLENVSETKGTIREFIPRAVVQSKIQGGDITNTVVMNYDNATRDETLKGSYNSKISKEKHIQNSELNTTKYVQDINTHSVNTKKSSNNSRTTNIDEVADLGSTQGATKHKYNTSATTNISDKTKHVTKIHDNDIKLERNTPVYSMNSNTKGRGTGDLGSTNTDYHRLKGLNLGGMEGKATMPIKVHENYSPQLTRQLKTRYR